MSPKRLSINGKLWPSAKRQPLPTQVMSVRARASRTHCPFNLRDLGDLRGALDARLKRAKEPGRSRSYAKECAGCPCARWRMGETSVVTVLAISSDGHRSG